MFVLAHFGHHLLTALPTPLLPLIRTEFNLDYTQSGLLISAFSLSYGLGQLPAGWLADRLGPRILITIGICGVALAGLLVGLSQSFVMIVFFLALMGLLGGGYHPSAPPLISASVPPEKQGQALGLHVIGGSGSYFISPLVAVAIASVWGWRGSFIGLAIPSAVFGALFFVLLGRRTGVEAGGPIKRVAGGAAAAGGASLKPLVVFIILGTWTGAVVVSVVSFIPLFVVDHFKASEQTAAAFLAIIYMAGIWAAPLGGYLSDRIGRVPVMLTVCFLAGPLIILLNLSPFGPIVAGLLLALGMCLSIRMPVTESYIVSRSPERYRSTILGIYFFAAMESGGVLTPVMGFLIDRFGFLASYSLAGGSLLVMTTICAFLFWIFREQI